MESGGTSDGDPKSGNTRYAEAGVNLLPSDPGNPGTGALWNVGDPGTPDNPHSGCLAANTDGTKFVAESAHKFDVIIIDSTDPIGPGEKLFTDAFYRDCKALLRPGCIIGIPCSPLCSATSRQIWKRSPSRGGQVPSPRYGQANSCL